VLPNKAALRFHDLRHTAASLAIAAGAHPKQIQEMLGHSSITTTLDRYGHLSATAHEALAAKLDEMFSVGDESSVVATLR
jgi:integrase